MQLFPPIQEIAAKVTGETVFQLADCKIKVALISSGKYSAQPMDKCSLKKFLDSTFPKNKLKEDTNSFIDPDAFEFKKLEIDKNVQRIEIDGSAKEEIDVVPNKFSIKSATITFKIPYQSSNIEWKSIGAELSGDVSFSGKTINIKFTKPDGQDELDFEFQTDKLTIEDFIKKFTSNLPASKESSSVLDKVLKFTIEQPKATGFYDPKGLYEFVLSGESKNDIMKTAKFFVVIEKPPDEAVRCSVVVSFDAVSPTKVLTELTGKDLSKVSFLKDVTVSFLFEASSETIPIIKDQELLKVLKKYITGGKTICKGVKLKMDLPLKDIIKKASPDLNVNDIPESLKLNVFMDPTSLQFKLPKTFNTDLITILKGLAPKAQKQLPDWINDNQGPSVEVREFSFDYKSGGGSLELFASGPITLVGLLEIKKMTLKGNRKSEKDPWVITFESTQKIFDTVMESKLTMSGESYELKAKISLISTTQLARYFGASLISQETLNKYPYLDFGMKDCTIETKITKLTVAK